MSNDKFQVAFLEEASELLEQLETLLIELEQTPDNRESLEATFRVMHTLKGAAGMFGFSKIETFTHDLETVFDLLRDGKLSLNEDLIDLSLRARDQLLLMLGDEAAIDENEVSAITAGLKKFSGDSPQTAPEEETNTDVSQDSNRCLWWVKFVPKSDLLLNGTNPLHLLEDLQSLGEMKAFTRAGKLPALDKMNGEQCYLTWDILLDTANTENSVRDVFIFVEDECDLSITGIAGNARTDLEHLWGELTDYFRSTSEPDKGEIAKMVAKHAHPEKTEEKKDLPQTPGENKTRSAAPNAGNRREQTIKVGSRKLDELVNLVGELVSLQARLDQMSQKKGDIELTAIAESFNRLTMQLRDSALNMRMLPIGTLFNKFGRLTRDLAKELDKKIEFETSGEDTELDKTVIEQLNDPLVHLIRNAADHGVESPEERRKAGKPEEGRVHLSAEHSGGHVLIRIIDDGKGIDPQKIFAKAVEKGLVHADAQMSEREIFNLLFEPGFSTAEAVTRVSGRGVGMDVVRRTIEGLRGTIEVESRLGKGSVFTLKLPLTLAIIDGLLVNIGGNAFVLPLSSVNECLEIQKTDLRNEKRVINLRGSLVPYLDLRRYFEIVEEAPQIQQVAITTIADKKLGLLVDEVLGQHQTVIKSLGPLYEEVRGVAGATILGSGEVALILDIQELNRIGEQEDLLELASHN
ncbi:MAG TPA: chemotaxis protein CheA [Calditrichia bacterium]|nr:chemotaxis protein CheA [Calditrichota bacterium]HQU71512.1 chemotaxis protein CheA [Calditrichia bacterium]HQV30271.1 chemotaxis protein CheA [Calditrichia bacterium]